MTWIPDGVLDHLRGVAELPDLPSRYRFVARVGAGGMGAVYRVLDRELEREVALKVSGRADAPSRERFLREARVLARLEHPNIVPVHDVGELPDGRPYCTMALVRGRTLGRLLQEGAPRPALLRTFQKVCEAVAFAHAHGVVHRDLKPDNVMVGAFGEAVVLDWGVARLRDGPAESPGTIVGTPAYMAPEQASGDLARVDERTDVFALGAILYWMLVGRAPFEARSTTGALTRAAASDPGRPREHDRSIPRPLESICLKAMAREPSDRYASAGALAADVGRLLDGEAVTAHRETPVEQVGRVLTKHRVILVLVVAYLVMRVLVFVIARR